MKALILLVAILMTVLFARADTPSTNAAPSPTSNLSAPTEVDWTVAGKTYHNVKVGNVEIDRVHITYDGGIGTVPLADLPPDLQMRFNYDPTAAKSMTQQRQQQAAQSDAEFYAQQAKQDREQAKEQKGQQVAAVGTPLSVAQMVAQKQAARNSPEARASEIEGLKRELASWEDQALAHPENRAYAKEADFYRKKLANLGYTGN